ncbi:MAG: tetratricopeptide repeat protein [Kofleriaceae bacterium]
MQRFVVAVALVMACRGDHAKSNATTVSAGVASIVPKLGISEDGVVELRALDRRIELHRSEPIHEIGLLLLRATYRGHVEDYQAAEQMSAELVATTNILTTWDIRTRVLTAIHDFSAAREALIHVKKLSLSDDQWIELSTAIDEAAGRRDRSIPARAEGAKRWPSATNLTVYAASLAFLGQFDAGIALIPKAAKSINDNSPETFAWLLFQWGRLYEQKGDFASARAFYQAAHDRLPGYVEANAHLALTMISTGDTAGAKRVVADALKTDQQPSLLELAAQLGIGPVEAARAEWERYVTTLPKAFADHAARFYLGVGKNPQRALELARINLANRDVPEARELVIQAALAAGDTAAACEVAGPLIDAPLRAHRFAAWQAFSRCGRTDEANRLAKDLGITP